MTCGSIATSERKIAHGIARGEINIKLNVSFTFLLPADVVQVLQNICPPLPLTQETGLPVFLLFCPFFTRFLVADGAGSGADPRMIFSLTQ
jgi:hypothetical protein